MSPDVLSILTNYKRPRNLRLIVDAFRRQTHSVDIVVVDNHPESEQQFALPNGLDVEDIWRFRNNAGPPCRFAPAWMLHQYKYCLFFDDDLLPGSRAVEHLQATAALLNGRFATIGRFGRRFHGGNRDYMGHYRGQGDWRYVPRNIKLGNRPTPVDMTCRAHFVRADCMWRVLEFTWAMRTKHGDDSHQKGDRRGWWREDDMLLALGIQRDTGYPSYLVPHGDPETSLRRAELPDKHAHSRRPDHGHDRSRCVRMAVECGWQSLWHDAEARK
jgi:hypothetical protein